MEIIKFRIPGKVQPQGRPRASSRGGYVRLYDPPTSRDYKKHVKEVAKEYAPSEPLEGPLHVRMTFSKQYLKSWTKKQRANAEDGILLPTTKPDIDNLSKGIMDALNGVIWKDDSQVVELLLSKIYDDEHYADVEIITL